MPITLKTGAFKYRKSDGTYDGINAIAQETTDQEITDIENAGSAQVAAVNQKGLDTLASIPDDYTTLSNEVSQLSENKADQTEVDDLKSAIRQNDGWEEITGWSVNKRYYNLSGSTVDVSSPSTSTGNCHCVVVSASAGDQFTITATGGTNSRAYGFVASDGTILEVSSSGSALSNTVVTAPANTTHLVINDTSLTGRSYYGATPVKRFDWQAEINKGTNNVVWQEITPAFEWVSGSWNPSTGTAGTGNKRIRTSTPTIDGLNYYIKAESGVVFYPTFYGDSDSFVARDSTPYVSECYISGVAPSGATGFRLTAKTIPEADISSSISTVSAKIHFYVQKALDKYQGSSNAGLSMVVDNSGNVVPGVSTRENQIDGMKTITDLATLHISVNLCNPDDLVIGRLENDGTIDDTVTGNKTTGYIPVTSGDSVQIYRNNSGDAAKIYHTRYGRYDSSKTLIDVNTNAGNVAFTIPDGTAFIRYSFDATYTPMVAINYTEGDPFIDYVAPYLTCDYDFLTSVSGGMLSDSPMRGKKIVNFGDSIFGNFRSETTGNASESISHMVQTMTGATCYNCAFGGTHAKTITGTDRAPMDFQSLVTAIIADSWTDQESYAGDQGTDYLARVQALEAIDFSTIDVITVSYGTNDWSSQVTPVQYEAALTDGISRLQTAFPNLLCVICTPIIRFKHSDDTGDDDAEESGGESEGTGEIVSSDTIESSSGYKLTEYAAKAEDVGHALHCQVSENYWSLGINLQNYSTFMGGMAAADLVHPNAKGRRLIANHLADALNRM